MMASFLGDRDRVFEICDSVWVAEIHARHADRVQRV
jgi:hypothetical protein